MSYTDNKCVKSKVKAIVFSFLWAIVLLVFPVSSGVISTVLKLKQSLTFCLQGVFMLVATIIPILYIKLKRQKFSDYCLNKTEKASSKKVLFYIPLVLIVLPDIIVGVDFKSAEYIFSLIFFTLSVAIAEEFYFRGVIYIAIKNAFHSQIAIIVITSLVFGIGHGASIIGSGNLFATLLQIVNAFFFGVVAIETVILTKSIIPAMFFHFTYNLGNYLTVASGTLQIVCIIIQVTITLFTAFVYGCKIKKDSIQDAVITIGIIKNGEVSYKIYGNNGVELEQKQHTYEIGSMTKTVTATLIYKAISEGKLNIDDRIDKYLTLPQKDYYPTIKRLLTHTSGYKSHYFESEMFGNFFSGKNDFYGISTEKMISRIGKINLKDKDYKFEYSNFGFSVLGIVLSKAYGIEYEQLVNAYLQDLGLTDTKISDGQGDLGKYWDLSRGRKR